MPNESYVQVALDGSGKKIRNVQLTEPTPVDSSGLAQADTVRYDQVIQLADERGDLVLNLSRLLIDIRDQQARTNELLELLLMQFR